MIINSTCFNIYIAYSGNFQLNLHISSLCYNPSVFEARNGNGNKTNIQNFRDGSSHSRGIQYWNLLYSIFRSHYFVIHFPNIFFLLIYSHYLIIQFPILLLVFRQFKLHLFLHVNGGKIIIRRVNIVIWSGNTKVFIK